MYVYINIYSCSESSLHSSLSEDSSATNQQAGQLQN